MTSSMAPLQPPSSTAAPVQPSTLSSVKVLAELTALNSIPANYAYFNNANDYSSVSDPEVSIPVIDFSLLNSNSPDDRLKVVEDLGRACQDWGFFMVVNHGIPEALLKAIVEVTDEFFNLPEEEKLGYETKHVLDPIRCGTSFNASKEQIFFWRDYLKVLVHPQFHCPDNPKVFSGVFLDSFSSSNVVLYLSLTNQHFGEFRFSFERFELLMEYVKRTRQVARKLLGAISQSLGLEEGYIEKLLDLDSGLQIFIANYYPPCPQPELAMGLPPHSDHGLLTLLLQNGVGGLQIQHKGKWMNVNALSNSFLVNTGDHLEILSNGKYKSVVHRAAVNNKTKRISIGVASGPSLDTCVGPATSLLTDGDGNEIPAAYIPMKYREYVELQQGNQLDGKSCLDRVKNQVTP